MGKTKQKNSYTMSRGGIMIGNEGDNAFNSVELNRPGGSWFDLTHDVTGSCNFGNLIPCNTPIECYPGDKFKIDNELLIRTVAMTTPAMQRMDATIHNFFIPERILHREDVWDQFIRGEAITRPYIDIDTIDDAAIGSIADYMGVPEMTGVNTIRVLASVFCAYQRVFFEYYRNQNLSIISDNAKPYLTTGDNVAQKAMLLTMRKRAWAHDYFTSALPFTQKGSESQINVEFEDVGIRYNSGSPLIDSIHWDVQPELAGVPVGGPTDIGVISEASTAGLLDNLYAQTSALSGTSFTINEFRLALATQHWLERMAVGGTRTTEIIKAHFGVTTSDQRLDRPEYIGGLKTPIVISEVLQTSESASTPQGNQAGHGMAASFSEQDDYYEVEEWGWIISIMSVIPKARYMNGLHRSLDWHARNTRDELYWPEFANLGEQAIKRREIFANDTPESQDTDWGYTGRYNELRGLPSRVCGELKEPGGTLTMWTAARSFDTAPALNEDFITDMQDVNRLFPVDTDISDPLIFNALHKIQAYRLMPKFAVPELVG